MGKRYATDIQKDMQTYSGLFLSLSCSYFRLWNSSDLCDDPYIYEKLHITLTAVIRFKEKTTHFHFHYSIKYDSALLASTDGTRLTLTYWTFPLSSCSPFFGWRGHCSTLSLFFFSFCVCLSLTIYIYIFSPFLFSSVLLFPLSVQVDLSLFSPVSSSSLCYCYYLVRVLLQ